MDSQFLLFLLVVSLSCVAWKSGPVFVFWMRARKSGAPISLWRIWRMYFQNLPLEAVVDAHAAARRANVEIDLKEIAAHAIAGGDVRAVVYAYVETLRAGTEIDFQRVCELELTSPEGDEVVAS